MLTLFWYRRDLRLHDVAGLFHSLKNSRESSSFVQPIFIFDTEILKPLKDRSDARVTFLHDTVRDLKKQFCDLGSDLWVLHGKPLDVFKKLQQEHSIHAIYTNHDYEPAAIRRDQAVEKFCQSQGIRFHSFKDQVVFEKSEVETDVGRPYTVYTPYQKKWLKSLSPFYLKTYPVEKYRDRLHRSLKPKPMPTLDDIGFDRQTKISIPEAKVSKSLLQHYQDRRDIMALDATSHLGIHFRFGTLSVRDFVLTAQAQSPTWLSELIWREFFMQILFHFPHVETSSFRPEYEKVAWRSNKSEFERWCAGETGYPLVDAGMRELNMTGFMHNRARMVTASFLSKHLLMYWREGERYFAQKLLDYDLAANNGNWQWAASTGCDAAPYFRIFNPESQARRFDPDFKYIRKWVPEYGTSRYAKPVVEHSEARTRALQAFQAALKGKKS